MQKTPTIHKKESEENVSVKSSTMSQFNKIPEHIAIIMDGNGRWAEKRGLLRYIGHEQGAKTVQDIIQYISELGIKYVTLYAFSSENWQRPREEIDAIMQILDRYLNEDVNELIKNGVRIAAIGDLDRLPSAVKKSLAAVTHKTAHCNKIVITLALSYGAWGEMVQACQKIVMSHQQQGFDVSTINEKMIRSYLYTSDLPDPDLFIRTGGEIRLSNFLLLQISYSELYFCKTLWPDFKRADLDRALSSFQGRERRFGEVFER
jgi:undecaprenyl diphosphate synthase